MPRKAQKKARKAEDTTFCFTIFISGLVVFDFLAKNDCRVVAVRTPQGAHKHQAKFSYFLLGLAEAAPDPMLASPVALPMACRDLAMEILTLEPKYRGGKKAGIQATLGGSPEMLCDIDSEAKRVPGALLGTTLPTNGPAQARLDFTSGDLRVFASTGWTVSSACRPAEIRNCTLATDVRLEFRDLESLTIRKNGLRYLTFTGHGAACFACEPVHDHGGPATEAKHLGELFRVVDSVMPLCYDWQGTTTTVPGSAIEDLAHWLLGKESEPGGPIVDIRTAKPRSCPPGFASLPK